MPAVATWENHTHMVHYAVKRMFSESATDVMFVKLPWAVVLAAGNKPAEECRYRCVLGPVQVFGFVP